MDDVAFSRELLQARLLVELMSQAAHRELVLKGGLALRAVMGSTRYTKDIDLDAVGPASEARLQGIVRRALERVTKQPGLIEDATWSEPKQTGTTLRWKVNGRAPGSARPIALTVEISRRPWTADFQTKEVELSPDFAAGAAKGGRVLTLDEQALAVCKVLALTDPNRDAARDLFDLSVLLETPLEDPAKLLVTQERGRLQLALDELWAKVEKMDYARFKQDVAPYLRPETVDAISEEDYEEMRVNVAERVEQWLEAAVKQQETDQQGKALAVPGVK